MYLIFSFQLNEKLQRLDHLPRAESAQRRFAIIKLQKDFERIRAVVQTMIRESGQLKVGNNPSGGESRSKNSRDTSQADRNDAPRLQALVARDVDDLIMEEREQDILRLNRDVALVNEMYKDMAEIIEKQGVVIEEIHTSTEQSRERAEEGLNQVKKAAELQPVCTIS